MHRSRAYLAVLLACALLLGSAAPSFGATKAELDAHRSAASDARKKAAEAQKAADALNAETAALDKQIASLQADADALDPKISEASVRRTRLQLEVDRLKSEVNVKRAEIESTTAEYTLQQKLLADRVEATYRQGQWFFVDVLLGARDFGDLVTRTDLVGRVIRANNDIASNLSDTRDRLESSKAELDRSLQSASDKKREAEAVEHQLKGLQDSRQAKVNQRETVFNQKSALLAENKKNVKRLLAIAQAEEAEADRVASVLKGRGTGSGVYNGVMKWPVDGGYVSSPFGWRIHPIFKTKKFHKGIDIAAPLGTTVYAAGSGTVIKADYGWGGGYGNRIWIDHGNGVVTTYNHLKDSSFNVRNGQHVDKGDVIARVGSTGYSTGAHLHFEVWVNGEPKNPMTYLQ